MPRKSRALRSLDSSICPSLCTSASRSTPGLLTPDSLDLLGSWNATCEDHGHLAVLSSSRAVVNLVSEKLKAMKAIDAAREAEEDDHSGLCCFGHRSRMSSCDP